MFVTATRSQCPYPKSLLIIYNIYKLQFEFHSTGEREREWVVRVLSEAIAIEECDIRFWTTLCMSECVRAYVAFGYIQISAGFRFQLELTLRPYTHK